MTNKTKPNKPDIVEDTEYVKNEYHIYLPPDTTKVMEDAIRPPDFETEEEEEAWAKALPEDKLKWMLSYNNSLNYSEETFENKDNKTRWRDKVVSKAGHELGIKRAKMPPRSTEGESVADTVLRALSHIGEGTKVYVPLMNSGFGVVINPIPDSEFIELYRRLYRDKISIGRYTYGQSYSNASVYTVSRFTDFILKHASSYTIDIKKSDDIRNYITEPDIALLEWGLASVINLGGIDFERPCSEKDCNHISTGKLFLERTMKIDDSLLTDDMLEQVYDPTPNNISVKKVRKYQSDINNQYDNPVTIVHDSTSTNVTFNMPSVATKVKQGKAWIKILHDKSIEALGKDIGEDERSSFMEDIALSSTLCEYSHWVKEIDMGDGLIVKDKAILPVLEALSSGKNFHNEFMKALKKTMNERLVALIGIENYQCTACQHQNTSTETKDASKYLSTIIPLRVNRYFFTILGLKVSAILKENNLAS